MFLCFKKPYIGDSKNVQLMEKSNNIIFYNENQVISFEILNKKYDIYGEVIESYVERGINNSNVTYFFEIKSLDNDKKVFYIASDEKPSVYTTSEMIDYE
jgi:hypothetical protein